MFLIFPEFNVHHEAFPTPAANDLKWSANDLKFPVGNNCAIIIAIMVFVPGLVLRRALKNDLRI